MKLALTLVSNSTPSAAAGQLASTSARKTRPDDPKPRRAAKLLSCLRHRSHCATACSTWCSSVGCCPTPCSEPDRSMAPGRASGASPVAARRRRRTGCGHSFGGSPRARSPSFRRRPTSSTTSCRPSSWSCCSDRGASTRVASGKRAPTTSPRRRSRCSRCPASAPRLPTGCGSSTSVVAGAHCRCGWPAIRPRASRACPTRTASGAGSSPSATAAAWGTSRSSPPTSTSSSPPGALTA
jgi:hypothetical protein